MQIAAIPSFGLAILGEELGEGVGVLLNPNSCCLPVLATTSSKYMQYYIIIGEYIYIYYTYRKSSIIVKSK